MSSVAGAADKSQSQLNLEHAVYQVLIGLTACDVLDKIGEANVQ